MTELLPIPPIETATDPIQSPADMRERWRALMGPLGFGERLLWVGFVGKDRRMYKTLTQSPIGRHPNHALVDKLLSAVSTVLADFERGTTVALLLTRPGRDSVSPDDERWSETLTRVAQTVGLTLEPIFRANDTALVEI
jgi:hypothetical protein